METKLVPPLDKIFTLQCAFVVVSKQKCCFLMPQGNAFAKRKALEAIFYEVTQSKNEWREREERRVLVLLTYWVLQLEVFPY